MERVATRGRPKGSRGRGKGKRGRKPRQIVSDEDENVETNVTSDEIEIQEDPVSEKNVTQQENQELASATTETKSPADEVPVTDGDVSISEADHEEEVSFLSFWMLSNIPCGRDLTHFSSTAGTRGALLHHHAAQRSSSHAPSQLGP